MTLYYYIPEGIVLDLSGKRVIEHLTIELAIYAQVISFDDFLSKSNNASCDEERWHKNELSNFVSYKRT